MIIVSIGRRTLAIVALISSSLVGCGGGGGGGSDPPPPAPATPAEPTISVSPPATSTANRTVPLTATVSTVAGVTVTSVEFLVDAAAVGSVNTEPYTIDWDTSTVPDGDHTVTARVTDNLGRVVNADDVTVSVLNNPVIHVELGAVETFPPLESEASGSGDITINLVTGAVTGGVTIEGLTATLAHIHRGFAGVNGPVVVDFVADPADPARWNAVEDRQLSPEDIDNLLAGALYVNVHTAAHPAGEIRGQLRPDNIQVVISDMSHEQVVPAAPDAASGKIATTIDGTASTATVHVLTSELVEPTAAHVHEGAAGTNTAAVMIELTQSDTDPNRWFVERSPIDDAQLGLFDVNEWYVDVHTAGSPDGALRGQIDTSASPPPPPPPPAATTLAELQANVFGPICSGCHTGVGASLPGSMNLSSTSASFQSLVGVPSEQQSSLLRVSPGDSANSYLIHKVTGAPTITGARMPFGGTPLDDATIDQIRSWIDAGANQ